MSGVGRTNQTGLTSSQFWGRIEATRRVAALRGARFPDDTPMARARRRAAGLLYPERFNATYLRSYFRDKPADFHVEIYRSMLEHKRLCVRAPRGHSKSTILTFAWPVHQVACAAELLALREGRLAQLDARLADAVAELLDADPTMATHLPPWEPYLQVISVTTDLAEEFTASIQVELAGNDLLRSDWPALQTIDGDQADGDWVINDVRVKAFGMTSGIQGSKHGPWRPFRALIDDPDSKLTVRTLGLRDQQESTLSAEVEFGLEPVEGSITMAATTKHIDCLARRLDDKERYPEWRVLVYTAITPEGEALWPERFPLDKLIQLQHSRPEFFASEMMDTPPVEGGRPFLTFHRYSRAAYADVELPKVLAFDPALGRTEKSDFQALAVLRGPTVEGKFLLHRCELLRIGDPLALVGRVNAIVAEENPDICVMEAIGFQVLLKVLLAADVAHGAQLVGWDLITRQQDSKDLRIRSTAPLVNDGVMQFPDDKTTAHGERQYTEYPSGKKDFPDVVEMALRRARNPAKSWTDIQRLAGRAEELGDWL